MQSSAPHTGSVFLVSSPILSCSFLQSFPVPHDNWCCFYFNLPHSADLNLQIFIFKNFFIWFFIKFWSSGNFNQQAINFFSVQEYDVRSISRNCSVCRHSPQAQVCVNNISQLLEHRNSYIFSNGCKQQLYCVFQYILLEQASDIQQLCVLRVPPIYGTICMCCSHLTSICVFGKILFSIPDPAPL